MFIHFSIMLIVYKKKKLAFPQSQYDDLFHCIENNLRELGFGDVSVNKKMKDLNKIFYDILLKINISTNDFKINEKLIYKYFVEIENSDNKKYEKFDLYFTNFYHFCFEINPEIMIKETLKFEIK